MNEVRLTVWLDETYYDDLVEWLYARGGDVDFEQYTD